MKMGVFFERSRKNQSSFGSHNGFYNFGDNSANPLDTGFGFSNAALGVYQNFDQASGFINGQYRYWNIEGYVQDTWKITPRLTLDYGLRIQWYQPQYDASLQASTFVLSAWNPAQAPRLYQPADHQRRSIGISTQLLARFSRLMISACKFQAPVTPSTAFCRGTEASTNISRTTADHSGDHASE